MSDYVLGTYVPNAVAPIRSWDAEVLRKNVYDCVRRQKQYSRMAPYAHRDYLHMLLSYLKQLLQHPHRHMYCSYDAWMREYCELDLHAGYYDRIDDALEGLILLIYSKLHTDYDGRPIMGPINEMRRKRHRELADEEEERMRQRVKIEEKEEEE